MGRSLKWGQGLAKTGCGAGPGHWDPCSTCEVPRLRNPLPQTVKDEIDRTIADLGNMQAIKRIRELAGCGLREAIMLHDDRYSAIRAS
jgi:hypothetical protein